jgi:DNA-binding winged helix-turn-helix (wHTH) protein/Tfp pilus assembly protein PilF/TolB-like protein
MKPALREDGPRTYEFGPFRLVPERRLLTYERRPADMSPKAFELLVILVEGAGHVISKNDLMKRLWPDTFVEENNLAQAVSNLRQALADDSDSPQYVKTIPRRGYIFIHPVHEVSEGNLAGPREVIPAATPIPAVAAGSLGDRRRRLVSIALSLLCAVALIYFLAIWYPHSRPAAKKADSPASVLAHVVSRRSVAVVGIRNASARPSDAWLSTALAEMLTTELADGSKLRVLSQENVARLKADLAISDMKPLSNEQLSRIHTALGADLVVSGTYVLMGDKPDLMRVDLRVQEPVSGEDIASIAESGRPTDLFEIVSHAGARLREKLQLQEASRDEAENVKASMPSSPAAARLYAQGLVSMRSFDVLAARDLFEKTIGTEPQFALGHSRLAAAWSQLGYDDRAKEEAKKAFDLSGSLSQEERLWVEGNYREMAKEWDLAIEIYRRLWSFHPDEPEFGMQLASAQTSANRPQDAIATIDDLQRSSLAAGDRARVDLAEAVACDDDQSRQLRAAKKAAAEGDSQDARLLVARARLLESYAYGDSGGGKQALDTAADAQRLFAAIGDKLGYARAIIYEANVLRSAGQGNFAKRKQLYEEALAVCQSIGNKRCEAGALNNLAGVLEDWGDLPGAKKRYEGALAVRQAINDKKGVALALNNIGTVLQVEGDLDGAKKEYEQAFTIYRSIGAKPEQGMTLGNIAEVIALRGDLNQAKNTMRESLRIWQELGTMSTSAADEQTEMGNLLFLAGDLDGAERLYEKSISMAASLGAPNTSTAARIGLARIWTEKGRMAEAEKAVRECREMFRREKQIEAEALAETLLLRILLRGGRPQEARTEAERASGLLFHTGGTAENFSLAIMFAEVQAATGDVAGATKNLRQILFATSRLGLVEYSLQTRLTMGEIEMKSGRPNGRAALKDLYAESRQRGFGMIAQQAERDLKFDPTPHTSAPSH